MKATAQGRSDLAQPVSRPRGVTPGAPLVSTCREVLTVVSALVGPAVRAAHDVRLDAQLPAVEADHSTRDCGIWWWRRHRERVVICLLEAGSAFGLAPTRADPTGAGEPHSRLGILRALSRVRYLPQAPPSSIPRP